MRKRKQPGASRREFIQWSAAAVGASVLPRIPFVHDGRTDKLIRVGLIGCGGRGTGAAVNALRTKGEVELVAMADAFQDRLEGALGELQKKETGVAERVKVDPDHRFVGFEAAERLIASDVDLVILATPPHFRPAHFEAAVAAGRHVFFEKPVAVDGPGVRSVLAATEEAEQKNLAVVCGLQRHHQSGYLETMKRVHAGVIGDIVAARCYWNMGGLWMNERKPEWSDMEWQLRNWLYFTWLSGDHIVEQHVHNLDVVNWAKQTHPIRCHGLGGRQVRTDPAYGHIYDHHSVHYEYADGSWMFSHCRQIDGCHDEVAEHLIGTKGRADTDTERWSITGGNAWTYDGPKNNPYQTEHDDLFQSIREGKPLNEGRFVAESTLTAIMGRMATYTGKVITWDDALNSKERLGPSTYEFGPLPAPPVPMPGQRG
jgi:predicted dehydrogenase